MTYTIIVIDGVEPEVGDDTAGSLVSIRDRNGAIEFDRLSRAKAVADQARRYVNASVCVINEDTGLIVYVA